MSLSPGARRNAGRVVTDEAILAVVLQAIQTTNAARPAAALAVSADATLFGPDRPLDSLGLLTLLLDIEEDMQRAGCPVRLSDDRAMSQTRSPFRSVARWSSTSDGSFANKTTPCVVWSLPGRRGALA